MLRKYLIILLALGFSALPPVVLADIQAEIRNLSEQLFTGDTGNPGDGETIYEPAFVASFYDENQFQPAWNDREQARAVLDLLHKSALEGLNPDDYHYSEMLALRELYDQHWEQRDRIRARFDMMLTDGIVLYVRHLLEGKVDPHLLDENFNYSRRDFAADRVGEQLRRAISDNSFARIVEAATPSVPFYHQMKAALAHYRKLAASGSFSRIPDGVVLKPGQSHANVVPLRRRLADTGYLAPDLALVPDFDADLEMAVRQFQRDHALDADGIVGRQSFQFLNMSYAQRVQTLRLNMDRIRWIRQDISDDLILVNIAGFELYYLRGGELIWEAPVMTGTVAHQTPIFTARLKYLEFNPTWTVPRSIIARSLFPKFSANPQYVLDNDYVLYDRSGVTANPLAIVWSAYNGQNFPYRVVQQPGRKNALGQVKFIFPNHHAVYLHDTASRQLFSRSARAFSAGCIRVKDPLEFAEVLLDDPQKWSLQQIRSLVDSRAPQQVVRFDREIDVALMYWTTSPTKGGRVQFHPDVYNKDAEGIAALNARPRVMAFAGR